LHDHNAGARLIKKAQNVKKDGHTLGPWCVSADADVHVAGDEGKIIAWCAEPNSLQNARLIAAAPGMLNALLEIQSAISFLIRDDRSPDGHSPSALSRKDLAKKINAAIAKATDGLREAIALKKAAN
jgi:hypothetical protein